MGLDQSWLVEPTKEEKARSLITGETVSLEEFGYFRKFWDLQEQMGTDNCEELIITETKLTEIGHWLGGWMLNKPNSHYDHDKYKELGRILREARRYLREGRTVTYCADW